MGRVHRILRWIIFTTAGDDAAERVELISSPEIDQGMHAAFSARHIWTIGEFSTPAGRRWMRGSAEILYKNIPLAAAFRVTLRLPDGRETPVHGIWPPGFSARTGSSGNFMVDPSNFVVEAPGRYRATLVLVPDPDLAYRDPAIKAIWSGTLEFPISFTITADEPDR